MLAAEVATLLQAQKQQDLAGDLPSPHSPVDQCPEAVPRRTPQWQDAESPKDPHVQPPLGSPDSGLVLEFADSVELEVQAAHDIRHLHAIRPGVDEAKELTECVVCWEVDASVLFQPCGHLCTCLACANACMLIEARTCPMCRTYVDCIMDLA